MAKLVLNVGFQHQMPDFVVVAPDPKPGQSRDEKLPVIWLLHDFGGDGEEWCKYGQLELIAKDRNILFVCPNSRVNYYQDSWSYFRYKSLIMEEIWDFINRTFPVSQDPADQMIIGNGMGGYGSFYLAFQYPGRFGKAVSLDGDVAAYERFCSGSNEKFIFPNTFSKDENNSLGHLSEQAAAGTEFVFACREGEKTFDANKALYDKMNEAGHNVQWIASKSRDAWPFWSDCLREMADRMIRF